MTLPDDSPINKLRDKTIAKIRTIVPSVWGILFGMIVTWVITKGWIDKDIAYKYKDYIVYGTGTFIAGIFVTIVYSLAQWVEERRGPVARFIAKLLLIILAQPVYVKPSPVVTRPDPTPETEPARPLIGSGDPKGITKPPA